MTEPLFEFIRNNTNVDIFCFQEILKGGNGKTSRGEIKSGYEDIQGLLPNHTGYFSEYGEGGYYSESSKNLDFKYGLACYVKSDLKQSFVQGISLVDLKRKWGDYSGRFAAGAALAVQVEGYGVLNIHGLWQSSIKTDTEAKIEQSKLILDLASRTEGRKIICGDFNLLPETESIKMLSSVFNDLIEDYSIKDTRGPLYTKDHRFSDYAFTDKKISVEDFTLPNSNVSDHLPLMIEFK
jgi:endonuclease/exonuclease/phosphatase family metal-dependent hydrolase